MTTSMENTPVFGAKFDTLCAILDTHERDPHRLVTILQEVQAAYSYLPQDVMAYIATALGISPGTVFGVATFYSHFTLEPKGKYVIRVCDGTACHVKKSSGIMKTLQDSLGLSESKKTSDDMLFTLEAVACLGACGLAPVVVVNEEVYGAMTKEKVVGLLQKIREEENANA